MDGTNGYKMYVIDADDLMLHCSITDSDEFLVQKIEKTINIETNAKSE